MKRSPIVLVVLAGLLVASTATAYLLIGQSSSVALPASAFTDQTLMAVVIDVDEADSQTRQSIKDTVKDVADSFGDLFGGQGLPDEILAEVNDAIDRFFGTLADQKIEAFAITVDMDFNELIRFNGEGVQPEAVATVLIKAGKEPDLVALASGIVGEEMPVEEAEAIGEQVSFKPLSDGWYAVNSDMAGDTVRVPAGTGDNDMAAKFNKAMANTAGGLLQVGVVIPEDAANALSGKMAAEMPEDAPEALREMVRSFSDMQSVAYSIDLKTGVEVSYYIVFDNAEAAKRMLTAYSDMMVDLPAMFEAANAISPIPMTEEEKAMMLVMQERVDEIMELMEMRLDNETIKMEITGDDFMKMIQIMSEMMEETLPDA